MKKKSIVHSAFLTPRVLFVLLVSGIACSIATGTLLAFLRSETPTNLSQRTLTFAERVAYQRAIEDVYWRHRIWPKERPDAKPPLDTVMSQAQLEKKVADYLRKSQALEDNWQRPITAEQLQAEMDRMAKHTRQPEVLQELFDALGNDPFVIAECLARPVLAERLLTSWYAYDERIHGELKQRTEAELQTHTTPEQMKQLSRTYTEIEISKSDSRKAGVSRGPQHSLKLNGREWDETLQRLAATFNQPGSRLLNKGDGLPNRRLIPAPAAVALYESLRTGKLSSLQEDETCYQVTVVMEKTQDHLKLATVTWRKEPLESWLARAVNNLPLAISASGTDYVLSSITDGAGCMDNTWTGTNTTNAPAARAAHTAVWTGSEMIVWGGGDGINAFNTGGRYNPSIDSWTATSTTNGPVARSSHTAVWSGTEMIVWGGIDASFNVFNSGGKYNPITDTWVATSLTNAPTARYIHTAVWAGSEMIIWGGTGAAYFNTGGRYNPNTDSWTATSTTNAPVGRYGHTAVWAGNEMIIWGGTNDTNDFNTGGRYNPSTNSWAGTSTTNAATARISYIAVWTGTEMIVWGGLDENFDPLNTGGRYNPATNSWTPTGTSNAPAARYYHTGVWTGNQMVIWGGVDGGGHLNTGGRYNPATNSWTATSVINAPEARSEQTAVWMDSEMIVWAGVGEVSYLNTGGRYCSQSGPTPTPTPTASATVTPTATATATATPTATVTPTPCMGRCAPTPRSRPTPAPRPTP